MYLGGAGGTFSQALFAELPVTLTSVATPADITGDGKLDLVYAYANTIAVRAGNGAGGFSAPVTTTLDRVDIIDTGRSDLDGRADVIATQRGVYVCCPDGKVTYSPPGAAVWLRGQATGALEAGAPTTFDELDALDVAAGDVDGDGFADAALALGADTHGNAGQGLRLLLGSPTGTPTVSTIVEEPIQDAALLLADFDDDGRDDLVSSRLLNNPDIFETRARLALPGGGFGAPVAVDDDYYWQLGAGDIDADGAPDVILPAAYDGVRVVYGTGDGGFEDETVYRWAPPTIG